VALDQVREGGFVDALGADRRDDDLPALRAAAARSSFFISSIVCKSGESVA